MVQVQLFSAGIGKAFVSEFMQRHVGKPLEKLMREFERALSWRWLYVRPEKIVELHRRQFQTLGAGSWQTGGSLVVSAGWKLLSPAW